MRYTKEVYKLISTQRPSLSTIEIDARSEATIMAWIKGIDLDAYMRIFRNK